MKFYKNIRLKIMLFYMRKIKINHEIIIFSVFRLVPEIAHIK